MHVDRSKVIAEEFSNSFTKLSSNRAGDEIEIVEQQRVFKLEGKRQAPETAGPHDQ